VSEIEIEDIFLALKGLDSEFSKVAKTEYEVMRTQFVIKISKHFQNLYRVSVKKYSLQVCYFL